MLISRCLIERVSVDVKKENLIEILGFIHKNGYWITQEITEKDYYTVVAEKYSSQVHEDTDGSLDSMIDFFKDTGVNIKWLPDETEIMRQRC